MLEVEQLNRKLTEKLNSLDQRLEHERAKHMKEVDKLNEKMEEKEKIH